MLGDQGLGQRGRVTDRSCELEPVRLEQPDQSVPQ